jgi:hypothetical protein
MTNKTLQKLAKELHKRFWEEISKTLQELQRKTRKVCPEFEHFLNNRSEKLKGDNYGQTRRKKEI